jgi:hypothetical protein
MILINSKKNFSKFLFSEFKFWLSCFLNLNHLSTKIVSSDTVQKMALVADFKHLVAGAKKRVFKAL